jgi:3-oxoacyl-[acyl-carrier-protein] synthase-3
MFPAALMAIKNANLRPEDIDMLIGCGSISEFIQPNMLTKVHQRLGLPEHAWVIPVGNDYSNFASSLIIADGLIRSKRAKNILICNGGNWTRNVDYQTGQAISAGDGAGAAVVAMSNDISKWYFADQKTVTASKYYGTMYTLGEKIRLNPTLPEDNVLYSRPFFHITDKGKIGFSEFGEKKALTSVTKLMKKNKLTVSDITFMPHQTSAVLIKYWVDHLNLPLEQVATTIEKFANITVAMHALNLAWFEENGLITKDNLIMLALGPGMHANAMLLKRNG